jgi:hypothetical protein
MLLGPGPLKICDIASYTNFGKYEVCCWAPALLKFVR